MLGSMAACPVFAAIDPNVRWGDGPRGFVGREPSARPTGVKRRLILSAANGDKHPPTPRPCIQPIGAALLEHSFPALAY